jgi:cation diffusion facilitator CzcD-associated flavoprotein CzcO
MGTLSKVDVLIVGAGFAGLYALHRLRSDGHDAVAVERGGDVGGVWYWNRYPGARCDVWSLEYSYSFSEELQQDWRWTEQYSGQPEIQRYARHVAERFDLLPHIHFRTTLTAASFNPETASWTVTLAKGEDGVTEQVEARFLLFATGSLSNPNLPDIPGLEDFKGTVLHTARWPDNPPEVAGKRIGVVGTGSTATQVIPELAKLAGALTVFQRTANYIAPARNKPLADEVDAEWKRTYSEKRAFARAQASGVAIPLNPQSALEVAAEERTARYENAFSVGGFHIMMAYKDFLTNEAANDTLAEFFRAKIAARVLDPETARKLSPSDYPAGGKRLCLEDGYYEVFNQPNVALVHLPEEPIERITDHGVKTSAREIDLDVMVFATGFDAITGSVSGVDIRGLVDQPLHRYWRENGPRAFLGITVTGFPNLFLVSGPGSPIGRSNAIPTIENNVNFIADLIGEMDKRRAKVVEARAVPQARWVELVASIAARTLYMKTKSWYNGANIPGKSGDFMIYIGGFPDYVTYCEQERVKGYPSFAFQ